MRCIIGVVLLAALQGGNLRYAGLCARRHCYSGLRQEYTANENGNLAQEHKRRMYL